VFLSRKAQIEKVLPCMMKHTLEKFVLPCVNGVVCITTTFDLWMSKGAFDIFALVINFLTLGGNQNMLQLVYLRKTTLLELILLINYKLCFNSIN